MITDRDIEKMKMVFATKDDLDRFATKKDLERFATKDDLKALELKMATKEDLKKFMTKEDLQNATDQLVDLITIGFNRTDKAIERLIQHEHRLDKLENKIFA